MPWCRWPKARRCRCPIPPETANLHYEIELVAAIGAGGANIAVENALDHVWGYAVGLDTTCARRDLQMKMREAGRPWELGKFDQSAPIGLLRPAAALPDIARAGIWLQVNGRDKQRSDIGKLIWSVAETVAYLPLLPSGSRRSTGTPRRRGPGGARRPHDRRRRRPGHRSACVHSLRPSAKIRPCNCTTSSTAPPRTACAHRAGAQGTVLRIPAGELAQTGTARRRICGAEPVRRRAAADRRRRCRSRWPSSTT